MVFKQRTLFLGEPYSGLHIARIELGLVQIEQRLCQRCVIVQETGDRRILLAITAQQQASLGVVHPVEDEFAGAHGGRGVARLGKYRSAFGEGRDHQAIPGSEDLVIEVRPDTLRPRSH